MVTATLKGIPGYFSKRKSLKVRLDSLVVHPVAQRTLMPSWLKYLEDNMDADMIGVLSVVYYTIGGREGYWIVDGQHRFQALMNFGCGDYMVEIHCYIDVQDDVRSCQLFRYLNKRRTVGTWDDYDKALKGNSPLEVGMKNCVESNGLAIGKNSADNTLNCIAALRKLYAKDKGLTLGETLKICKESWGTKASVLEGKLIEGLGRVISTYNGKIDKGVMIKKLQKRPAASILGMATTQRAHREGTMARFVGNIIIEEYNAGRKSNKLALL